MCVGFCELSTGELSPKSQAHELIVPEATVDKSVKSVGEFSQTVVFEKSATGMAKTLTVFVTECWHPLSDVTVSVTL